MMTYKGYSAKVVVDEEQGIFHGEVIGLLDKITFEGSTFSEFHKAFHDSVDDYLAFCEELGDEPEKPHSGRFLVRIDPELHRKCSIAAKHAGKSLNAWVGDLLERATTKSASAAPFAEAQGSENPVLIHERLREVLQAALLQIQ